MTTDEPWDAARDTVEQLTAENKRLNQGLKKALGLSVDSALFAGRLRQENAILRKCLQSLVGETMPTADDFNAARAALEGK